MLIVESSSGDTSALATTAGDQQLVFLTPIHQRNIEIEQTNIESSKLKKEMKT